MPTVKAKAKAEPDEQASTEINTSDRVENRAENKTDKKDASGLLPLTSSTWNPELEDHQIEYLDDYFETMRHNPAATATLICKGHQCEIYKHCPLAQASVNLPVGHPCPVERKLVEQWTTDLMNELGIEPDAHVDRAQVSEIVRSRLFSKRSQEILANHTALVDSYKGVDQEGNPLWESKLNPILPFFEKNTKMSEKILDSLIATRESKSRDKSRVTVTGADIVSGLMSRMRELEQQKPRAVENLQGNIHEEQQKRLDIVDAQWEPLEPLEETVDEEERGPV